MHISDGLLNIETCIAGYAVTAGLVGLALKNTKPEDVPKVSIMGAAFFISSLIHFKVGMTSVHLTFIGLSGMILGLKSPLALITGLFFQALMFQHGGFLSLGVNGCIFILPALVSSGLFHLAKAQFKNKMFQLSLAAGFISGFCALLGVLILWLILTLTGEEYAVLGFFFSISQLVLVGVEGIITSLVVSQFLRIRPQILLDRRGMTRGE